ncbi:hypothetical protein SAY86_000420 [Trapa natans]|uniref:RRM domain-containing protein n=1 Tax=Trapa natans TaxID=22666 RepID=A0AAN7RFP1_TRANT|nr:hypothetical protein SAY86_000420 [Trapa natans]
MAGAGMHPFHQQWAPAPTAATPPAPPQPPGVTPPPPHPHQHPLPQASPVSSHDEVRTIFITGLPEDVKERELQNLLRWLPGYEASQVNYKGEMPMGFALFSTAQLAIAARDTLQEMVFDAETKSVLHTEMAKKNLFVKRGIVADSNAYDHSKRMRTGGDYSHSGYSSPTSFHPPAPPVWGSHGYMTSHPPPYDPYGGYHVPPMSMTAPSPVPAPSSYQPVQNTKDNPPCNTLFIGNLGENINEEELRGLFSSQPGFKQMKILRQERHTVCFIEFEEFNVRNRNGLLVSEDEGQKSRLLKFLEGHIDSDINGKHSLDVWLLDCEMIGLCGNGSTENQAHPINRIIDGVRVEFICCLGNKMGTNRYCRRYCDDAGLSASCGGTD